MKVEEFIACLRNVEQDKDVAIEINGKQYWLFDVLMVKQSIDGTRFLVIAPDTSKRTTQYDTLKA